MKKEDISLQIKKNFKNTGWQIAENGLKIQPDPYTGWWIVIVSPDFKGKAHKERKDVALKGLENLHIEWLELLTPEEREMAGTLPGDVEVDDLPLWPEALARGSLFDPAKEQVQFLSDIDEDIEPPVIATFYSLRGGVGRSTALAYTAYILASQGRKVICLDMDLEAPGITAIFGKEKEIIDGMGLVHILMEIDQGGTPDITKHLLRISDSFDLYCLPAGRTDANYARMLRFIDPESWYREERNPLHELFDQLRNKLPFTADVILLDARTGITQLSGPLMFDLSDISIIVFFPHPQAKSGTEVLVKALMAAKTRRRINGQNFSPEVRFLVSPIPSSKAPEVVRRYQHRAIEWISEWISALKDAPSTGGEVVESDITHFVPYREVIATSDQILENEEIWRNFRQVAEWIEGFLEIPGEKSISEKLGTQKVQLLENLSFSTGTAELQEDFPDTFVETDLVKKAMEPGISLVLGRKGTGKTAIFRRLSEGNVQKVFIITSPADLGDRHLLFVGEKGFKEIEKILKKNKETDWREFWTIYICLIGSYLLGKNTNKFHYPSNEDISSLLFKLIKDKPSRRFSELEVIGFIEKFMGIPRCGLVANDWLFKLDEIASMNTLLLFDGLDTGFGNEDRDRERRNNAIEGLFTFMTDIGGRLKNFRFKIMLREDIWKSIKFENKSHFFGRSLSLKWADQISFFKVIIKQAMRNNLFKEFLLKTIDFPLSQPIEYWDEKRVIAAWNVLVGERMKGGKSAFTRNWVWKRLADSNNDHSPRYLLQLLHQAVLWEKEEQKRSSYERSIIRPRSLSKVLPQVSEQALSALRDEEFQELAPLLNNLKNKRTPINASELQSSTHLIGLAMEVGILAVYEESEEEVSRYMVPELYRHALNMKRKGQM